MAERMGDWKDQKWVDVLVGRRVVHWDVVLVVMLAVPLAVQ